MDRTSPAHVFSTVEMPLVRRVAWALFCGVLTHDKKILNLKKN